MLQLAIDSISTNQSSNIFLHFSSLTFESELAAWFDIQFFNSSITYAMTLQSSSWWWNEWLIIIRRPSFLHNNDEDVLIPVRAWWRLLPLMRKAKRVTGEDIKCILFFHPRNPINLFSTLESEICILFWLFFYPYFCSFIVERGGKCTFLWLQIKLI